MEDEESPPSVASGLIEVGELVLTKDEFNLLTLEQIEAMNVSQETKDQLIKLKMINVNWWKLLMVGGFLGVISEGGRKDGKNGIAVIALFACIVSAFKLGYF